MNHPSNSYAASIQSCILKCNLQKNKMGAIEIPQNARFQCVQIAVITRKIGYHYNTKELVKTKHYMGYYKLVLFQLD